MAAGSRFRHAPAPADAPTWRRRHAIHRRGRGESARRSWAARSITTVGRDISSGISASHVMSEASGTEVRNCSASRAISSESPPRAKSRQFRPTVFEPQQLRPDSGQAPLEVVTRCIAWFLDGGRLRAWHTRGESSSIDLPVRRQWERIYRDPGVRAPSVRATVRTATRRGHDPGRRRRRSRTAHRMRPARTVP